MVTTQEFKTVHNLSDSAFKRLVAKVKSARPDIEKMTDRTGNEWTVLHPELLEAEMNKRVKTLKPTQEPEVLEAEFVSSLDIVNRGYGDLSALAPKTFDHDLALTQFQLPEFTYQASSTASQVEAMHLEMIQSAVATRSIQDDLSEQRKRQAIEQGIKEAQEVLRLRSLAFDQVIAQGASFEAKKVNLKEVVQ